MVLTTMMMMMQMIFDCQRYGSPHNSAGCPQNVIAPICHYLHSRYNFKAENSHLHALCAVYVSSVVCRP